MTVKWFCTVFQDFPYQVLPQRNRKSLNTLYLPLAISSSVFSSQRCFTAEIAMFLKSFIWSSIMLVNGSTITKSVILMHFDQSKQLEDHRFSKSC